MHCKQSRDLWGQHGSKSIWILFEEELVLHSDSLNHEECNKELKSWGFTCTVLTSGNVVRPWTCERFFYTIYLMPINEEVFFSLSIGNIGFGYAQTRHEAYGLIYAACDLAKV